MCDDNHECGCKSGREWAEMQATKELEAKLEMMEYDLAALKVAQDELQKIDAILDAEDHSRFEVVRAFDECNLILLYELRPNLHYP